MSLSADGSRVAFSAGPIVVFDSTSGALVSTLALPGHVALGTGGGVLFHATGTTLERYDAATG